MATPPLPSIREQLNELKPGPTFVVNGVAESVAIDPLRVRRAMELIAAETHGRELAQISCFLEEGHLVFSWFFRGKTARENALVRSHLRVPASGEWLRMASVRDLWPRAEPLEDEISEFFGVEWATPAGMTVRTEKNRLVDERLSFPMRTAPRAGHA